MLNRLRSHVRHNVVAYLALFFALTGVAYAAGPLKAGDPAGGDLTGTYPNPRIAPGAVGGAAVANDSLTGADVVEASLGEVPVAGFASFAVGARNAGAVNRAVVSGPDPTPLIESSVFGAEIAGSCGVLRLAHAPGRKPPEAMYGYSFGDNDESGFFGGIIGDEFTIEGSNLTLSLVVERDGAFARVEVVKRGCEFTRWIIRSEDGDGS